MNTTNLTPILPGWPAMTCCIGLLLASGATLLAGEGFVQTSSLGTARNSHTSTVLPTGMVLVTGGSGFSGNLSSAELYDPAFESWTNAGTLLTPCNFATATLLPNGKVLVAGGFGPGGSITNAQLFDPNSRTWAPTGSLTTRRSAHSATLLPNGKVLVAGGLTDNILLASAELYDPLSETWRRTHDMMTGRWFHTATLLTNGRVLLAAGIGDALTGTPTANAEIFDPSTESWTPIPALATARDSHSASLLPDGRVMIVGGWNGSYLSSVEIYNPVSGMWSPGMPMAGPRGIHTATTLPDGRLLMAGGMGPNVLSTAQIYNPASTTWAPPIPLVTARRYHTESLLPNGRVLLTGGSDQNSQPLANAELWDPTGGIVDANALAMALDDPALLWNSGGTRGWSGFSSATHDGVDAARCGSISDNQESWLQSTVEGPGTLTFWWKVSTEADFDWLRFHIDGVLQQQISGEIDWQQRTFQLPAGTHTLKWRYVKDSNGAGGVDHAWLDQVSFTPAPGTPTIVMQPSNQIAWPGAKVTLTAVAFGTPPLTHRWLSIPANAVVGVNNPALVLNNILPSQAGLYQLVVSNALGSATSSIVSVTVTNNTPIGQVLFFSDSLVVSQLENALGTVGQSYLRFSDESSFNAAVTAANPSSTLAIVDAPQGFYAFSSLGNFIAGGGRVLIQAYTLAGSPSLAASLQVAVESRSTVPLPLLNWGGSSLLAGLPSPINFSEINLVEDAQKLHPLNGGRAIAGFSASPAPGEAAIIIGNGGRTIVNGFYVEGATPTANALRLAQNEIVFLGAVGAPSFSSQPQDKLVAIGATATFGVSVLGLEPITLQWRKNGQPIPGATATNYTIASVQSNDFGLYDIVATNPSGTSTSRQATLDLGLPIVVLQPPLSQSNVVGGSTTFSVEISGNPPPYTYEWRRLTAPLATNVFVTNLRTNFFTITNVAAGTVNFRLVVRNVVSSNGVAPPIFTLTGLADSDGDGLPDAWETAYNVSNPNADEDGDGFTNLQEFMAGTNPTNASSVLKIQNFHAGAQATFSFEATPPKTYSVQSSDTPGGNWTRVLDVIARATNHTVTLSDAASTSNRFYRLVTPRQP